MVPKNAKKLIILAFTRVNELRLSSAIALEQGNTNSGHGGSALPLVVNTWTGDFSGATQRAWDVISSPKTNDSTILDAIEEV